VRWWKPRSGLAGVDAMYRVNGIIDALCGSLLQWISERQCGLAPEEDGRALLELLRETLINLHVRFEDDTLFGRLVASAEVPGDRGPIAILRHEHAEIDSALVTVEDALTNGAQPDGLARSFAHLVWEHLDKEESVFLPTAETRLRRGGVGALEAPEMAPRIDGIVTRALELSQRYPPLDDKETVRGDGCVACRAFTETCRGIEAEWWNTWEWQFHRSIDDG
jgi:hypothetical protein